MSSDPFSLTDKRVWWGVFSSQGWNMCAAHGNQLSCHVPELGGNKLASLLLLMQEGVPGAKGRVAMKVRVVLCIWRTSSKHLPLYFFAPNGAVPETGAFSSSVGWGMHGAPFPSKANTFAVGKPSEFASSAGTFDPTTQLTAQLAVGSFHLS